MLRDYLRELLKDSDFKFVDELTDKDKRDISRFSEYTIDLNHVIAFKNQCSFFKTAGILITDSIYYGKGKILPVKKIKKIREDKGKYIVERSTGYSYLIPDNEELRNLILNIYDYYKDCVTKGNTALEEKRYDDCFKYRLAAAEFEMFEDINNLADCYANGWGVEKDIRKAVELYSEEIKDKYYGETSASRANDKGNEYYRQKHYIHALAYYEQSASFKNKYAMCNIGNIYYYGLGLKKDLEIAKNWYRKAASQDYEYSSAHIQLAYVYRDLKMYKEMNDCITNPYVSGSKVDVFKAQNYMNGWGVEKNYDLAKYHYEQATSKDKNAYYSFAYGCKKMKDYQGYYDHLLEAKRYGDKRAINSLGVAYEYGLGVKKDYAKALEYYHEAINVNPSNGVAYTNLANMYKEGKGIEKDYHKALEYYQKANDLNIANALANLGILYLEGKGTNQNIELGLQFLKDAVDKDSSDGKLYMAELCLKGELVGEDKDLAYEYIKEVVHREEADTKAKKAFIKYIMNKVFNHGFEDVSDAFHYALEINELEDDYQEEFIKVRDWYKKYFILEYDIEDGYDCSIDKEALLFYRDKTSAYFIGKYDGKDMTLSNEFVSDGILEADEVTVYVDNGIPYYAKRECPSSQERQELISLFLAHAKKYKNLCDYPRVVEYYEKAIELGDIKTKALLGIMYIEGIYFDQDTNQGIELLGEGADAGSIEGILYAAKLFVEDKHVDPNIELAKEYVEYAIEHEEDSFLAKKAFIDYTKNKVFDSSIESVIRAFNYALEIYKNDSSYKQEFNEIKNWYRHLFINAFCNNTQKDTPKSINVRLFYQDNHMTYFIRISNGEEITVYSTMVDEDISIGEKAVIYMKNGQPDKIVKKG